MQSNCVDFDRLKLANGLLQKWSLRFGVDKRDYLRFCFTLSGRADGMRSSLPKNMRSQFSKDCRSMFYASDVEGGLIEQYTPMVHSIIRKFITTPEQYEDLVTEGFVAIRCAVWHFRAHKNKANFTTFCHSSITKRIKWHRSKVYRKAHRRSKKCKMFLSTDLPTDLQFSDLRSFTEEHADEMSSGDVIGGLMEACNLSEQERFLIESYIRREDIDGCWYSEYNERFARKTRQGIHYQLHKIQAKLLRIMRSSELVPEGYEPRSGGKI